MSSASTTAKPTRSPPAAAPGNRQGRGPPTTATPDRSADATATDASPAALATTAPDPAQPRDAAYCASGSSVLRVDSEAPPAGASGPNASGRRVTGPIQGFGKMWEKTYSVRLSGAAVTPRALIAEWKKDFPTFWPAGNRFFGPLTGIAPGEVALLDLSMAPMATISTGVMVLYADEESFTLMTPQGHVFAGWITFSACDDRGTTVAHTKALMRASGPFSEVGLAVGGHARENRSWERTLRSLARHYGVEGYVTTRQDCVDARRQWSRASNVWHNAVIRGVLCRGTPRRNERRLTSLPTRSQASPERRVGARSIAPSQSVEPSCGRTGCDAPRPYVDVGPRTRVPHG